MISIIFKDKAISNSVMKEFMPAECDCPMYTRLYYVRKFLLLWDEVAWTQKIVIDWILYILFYVFYTWLPTAFGYIADDLGMYMLYLSRTMSYTPCLTQQDPFMCPMMMAECISRSMLD